MFYGVLSISRPLSLSKDVICRVVGKSVYIPGSDGYCQCFREVGVGVVCGGCFYLKEYTTRKK